MKKLRSVLVITLLISLVSSYALGDSFILRNDIIFGDDIETVKEKESKDNLTSLFRDSRTSSKSIGDASEAVDLDYLEYHGTIAGKDDSTLEYYFDKDSGKLLDMSYQFKMSNVDKNYAEFQAALTRKYGEPLGGDTVLPVFSNMLVVIMYRINNITSSGGTKADLYDYNEWLVETDDGAVKIELVSYYYVVRGSYYNWLNVNYHYVTKDELSAIQQDAVDKQSAMDDAL